MTEFSTSLLFIGVFLLLGSLLPGIPLMKAYKRLRGYQAGQCRIVATRVLETQSSVPSGGNSWSMTTTTMSRPECDFIVQMADGQQYQAQGYSALNVFTQFRRRNQAIANGYRVGATYPCWYDPANPTQAILTRTLHWQISVAFGGFFISGCICLIWGILLQLY